MEVRELKFLLKLAGLPEYKGKISELKPNSRTKVADSEKICRRLRNRALVACEEEITQFKLSSVGKALLKLDWADLPLTAEEWQILQACSQAAIAPTTTKITPANKRNSLINSLREKGLITAIASKIKQVWLTEAGKKYLLTEYNPQGTHPVLSLDLLNNYLVFLRQSHGFCASISLLPENNTNGMSKHTKLNRDDQEHLGKIDRSNNQGKINNIADEHVLQTIVDLDRHLQTGNYLPIFHLREKFPFLSREELDLALYRLQRQDKLELSSIVESVRYTREQLQAGIPQNVGGCLFFLIVSD